MSDAGMVRSAFLRRKAAMVRYTLLGIATLLLPVAAFAQAMPPSAKLVPFSENLHGETVSDPYRWMEAQDAEYQAWIRGQGDFSRKWLDGLPRRADLFKAIEARSGEQASLGTLQAKGGKLFLPRRTVGAQFTRLFVKEVAGSEERLILDPAQFDTAVAKGNAINYWEASPDGNYIFFGVSPGGSEESTLYVMEVASGKLLPGAVPQALFNGGGSQWLPDSSGFFYNRLAEGALANSQNYYVNSRAFFHSLKSDFSKDILVMQAGYDPRVTVAPIGFPMVGTQPGSKYAIMVLVDGVSPQVTMYAAPISEAVTGRANWKQISNPEDKVIGAAIKANDLYLLRSDRARGRVVKTSFENPSLATATEVVPESEEVILSISAARDGLYIVARGTKGTQVRFLGGDGALKPVALPFAGQSFAQFATADADGMFMIFENAVTPRKTLLVKGTKVTDTGLAPKGTFPTDVYASEAVVVTARDGAKVPLELFYRKDTPRDGKRTAVINAYGAYGINNDVGFSPSFTSLLDTGMVLAVAHVRGGGELGEKWWLSGKGATKPNTWRDAIDSAEYMIANGWTTKGKISIFGGSAGGIMVGGAITERPDLWASGIAQVGVMNALRAEFSPNGVTNIPEFGSVLTKAGFDGLRAMDAYHNIKDGVAYPPMLLTAGLNDSRVVPWQPAKFVAKMQAASTGGPVIFMVNTDQGHGIGSSRTQNASEFADVGAFALWAGEQKKNE